MNRTRLRRQLVVWWFHRFEIQYMAERVGRRSGRFVACALYGGWDNVPSYIKEGRRRRLAERKR